MTVIDGYVWVTCRMRCTLLFVFPQKPSYFQDTPLSSHSPKTLHIRLQQFKQNLFGILGPDVRISLTGLAKYQVTTGIFRDPKWFRSVTSAGKCCPAVNTLLIKMSLTLKNQSENCDEANESKGINVLFMIVTVSRWWCQGEGRFECVLSKKCVRSSLYFY